MCFRKVTAYIRLVHHPIKRMPLTRPTYLSTAFLLHCLCWLLLGIGLVLPASARTTRVHKMHRKHSRRHIHMPRMLPTFIPAAREGYATVLRGRASWYGRRFQGLRTSSGERFNRHEFTCAHKTLPFGTRLRVTNLDNGVTVVVRVSDRGPFRHQRIIDLAEVAARPLGLVEAGAASVVAEVVPTDTPLGMADTPANLAQLQAGDPNPQAPFTAYLLPEASPAPVAAAATPATAQPAGPVAAATDALATARFLVQAGTFANPQNAQTLLARILTIDQALPVEVVTATVAGHPVNRVVVGQLDSWLAAETVRRNLQLWGIAGLVYQLPADQLAGTEQLVARPAASAPLASAGPLR
jgi:rare lipoprotein A